MAAEVYLASSLPRTFPSGNKNRRWVYLGSKPAILERCEMDLGTSNRLKAAYDLEAIASELRPAFVSWIARLADVQISKEDFWSITFSSRSPETSDFFPLLCLTGAALKLSRADPALLILVDDPWVYFTLKDSGLRTMTDIAAQTLKKRHDLVLNARGCLAKLVFLLRGTARIAMSRLLFPLRQFGANSVALVSYAVPHALKTTNYRDPFFGDLPEFLKRWGLDPLYIFPLHTPVGEFSKIRNSVPNQVLKSCFRRARVKALQETIADISVDGLLGRELLHENSSNRYVLNCWQAETWKRLARQCPKKLIHIFENHPWEKSLQHALRPQCLRIGYQHATIPDLLMNYKPGGASELDFHPSRIVVNSAMNQTLLSEWGWPRENLLLGGALRYSGLGFNPPERLATNVRPIPTLYVALPGVHTLCSGLLKALEKRLNPEQKLRILLKFHPSFDSSRYDISKIVGAELTVKTIHQIGGQIDAVLFASSTVGLEACLIGFEVWRFVPDGMLTLNPVPRTLSNRPKPCDEDELKVLISNLSIRGNLHRASEKDISILSTPLNEDAWKKALNL